MTKHMIELERGAAFRNHPLISSAHAKGENRNVFESFIRDFARDLEPDGPVEATLAARAASLAWRLNRAQKLETIALSKTDRYESNLIENGLNSSDRRQTVEMISRWEQSLERSLFKTLDALRRLQKQRGSEKTPQKNAQNCSELVEAVQKES